MSAISDALLREALAVYVGTVPIPQRLQEWLAANGLEDREKEVRAALDPVVRDVELAIYRLPGMLDPQNEQALLDEVGARHRWLDRAALDRLRGFVRWYAWHEGFMPRGS